MGVRCLCTTDAFLFSGSDDRTINVWSATTPQGALRTLAGHRGDVLSLDVCMRQLWSGSADCSIRVWNYQTGECKAVLPHHSGWVHVMRAMGTRVWSASHDGSICIWSAKAISLLHRIDAPHEGLLQDVALAQVRTDTLLWSIGGDQVVRFWNVTEQNREDVSEWDELETCKEQMLIFENGIAEYQAKHAKLTEMLESAHSLLVKEKQEKELVYAKVSQLEYELEERDCKIADMTRGFEQLAEKHSKMRVMSNAFRDNVQAMLDEKRLASESPRPDVPGGEGSVLKKALAKNQELKEENNRLLTALQGGGTEVLTEEIRRLQQLLEMRTSVIESLKKKRHEGAVLKGGVEGYEPYEYPQLANPLETGEEPLKSIHVKDMLDVTVRQLTRKCSLLRAVLPLLGDNAGHLKDLVEREANNLGIEECDIAAAGTDTSAASEVVLPIPVTVPAPSPALSSPSAMRRATEPDKLGRIQVAFEHSEASYKARIEQLKAHLADREQELQELRLKLSRPGTGMTSPGTGFNDAEFNKDSLEIQLAAAVAENAIAEQTQERLEQNVKDLKAQLQEKEDKVTSLTKLLQETEQHKTEDYEKVLLLQKRLEEATEGCMQLEKEKLELQTSLRHVVTSQLAEGDIVEVRHEGMTVEGTVEGVADGVLRASVQGRTQEFSVSSVCSIKSNREEQLMMDVARLQEELGTLEEDKRSLKESLTGLEHEVQRSAEAGEHVAEIEAQLEAAEKKNRQLKEQMKSRVKLIEEGLAEAKQTRVEKDAETSRLQKEVDYLTSEMQKEEETRDQLLSEVQLLKEELQIAKKRAENLSHLAENDEAHEETSKKLSLAERNITELYRELQDANATITEMQARDHEKLALMQDLSVEKERTTALGRHVEISEGRVRELELRLQLQDKEVELLKMKLEKQSAVPVAVPTPLAAPAPPVKKTGEDSLTVSSAEPSPKYRQPSSQPRSEDNEVQEVRGAEAMRLHMDELRAQVEEAQKRASEIQQAAEHHRSQTRQLLPHAVPVKILKTKKFKSGKVVEEGATGTIIRTEGVQAGTMRVRMDVGDVVFDFKTSDLEILSAHSDAPIRSSSPLPLPPTSPRSPKNPQLGPMVRLKSSVQSGSRTWPKGTWAHVLLQDEETYTCALQMIHNNVLPNAQPQFAHKVPSSKIDFVDLPSKLYVVIPNKPPADGTYTLCDGVLHNGHPMWVSGDRIIRTNQFNAWMIGDIKEHSGGAGWAVSKYPHDGLFPHQVDIWQTFTNPAEPWTDDLAVRVSVRPLNFNDPKTTPRQRVTSPKATPTAEAQHAAMALSKLTISGSWRKQANQARSLPLSPC
eukprot:TRINITY_DN18243_c0_g1_i1.p1 TRINITY_DN18243_c0_g1~~TRINITY_DN18243_c0_g1_i1.p1  ORF type:complete len:1546 (+),score=515.26 TRINITY_DN18243_c0_g1_i1:671-4639(+)